MHLLEPFVLLLQFLTTTGNVQLLTIMNKTDQYNFNIDKKDIMLPLEYMFPHKSTCVQFQVLNDNTSFAEYMIVQLQKASISLPLARYKTVKILGKYIGCYLVLGNTIKGVNKSIETLPKCSEHRILIIVNAEPEELIRFLEGNIRLFADAEVLVVSFPDFKTGYKIGQPDRELVEVSLVGNPWFFSFKGVKQFNGREIKISTFNCSFYSKIPQGSDIKTYLSNAKGFDLEVIREICKRINATIVLVPTNASERYGKLKNDKFVGGIYSKLTSGEADVAFCGSLIEQKKTDIAIEMSNPLMLVCFKFITRRPDELVKDISNIFRPFKYSIWVTVLVLIVVLTVALKFISKHLSKFLNFNNTKLKSIDSSFLLLYGILVLGSWPRINGLGPFRPVIICWVVLAMLLTAIFTGELISELTQVEHEPKANYVKQFNKGGYYWPATTMPYSGIFDMNQPRYIEWFTKITIMNRSSFEEKLRKDRNAILLSREIANTVFLEAEHVSEDILVNYETVDHCTNSIYEGFAYRIGSPFNSAIDHYINILKESGIIGKILNDNIHELGKDHPSTSGLRVNSGVLQRRKAGPLHLFQLLGLFQILSVGLMVSFAVFVVECIVHNYQFCIIDAFTFYF